MAEPNPPPPSLDTLRLRIDDLDARLVDLLNERATVSLSIGLAKQSQAPSSQQLEETHVYIPAREKKVFEKVTGFNKGPLTNEAVEAIYREVMSASIALQKEVTIGYLGPPGTYSHQAALGKFGDSVNYIAFETIGDVYKAVSMKKITYGVVPFENSTHGTVATSIDQFIEMPSIQIRAETFLKVTHSLLSNSQRSSISRIYSHPEVFGQCRDWLDANFKGVELINVSSSANAACVVRSESNAAALCSDICGDIYGLSVLERGVNDSNTNTTRFFIIGTTSDDTPSTYDKTLVMFTIDHRKPGALCDALNVFKSKNINLTKIDTRPQRKKPWNYYFFIEFEGHKNSADVKSVLSELNAFCIEIQVLGSYPSSPTGSL